MEKNAEFLKNTVDDRNPTFPSGHYYGIFPTIGNAGFISSTVASLKAYPTGSTQRAPYPLIKEDTFNHNTKAPNNFRYIEKLRGIGRSGNVSNK